MFSKGKTITLLAGVCLFGMASLAFAQAAVVTHALADYKSASQELIRLYTSAKDEAAAKVVAAQINAATKRQEAAGMGMSEAMKRLDPESQQDVTLMENAFAEMQADNQAVANAQLNAFASQAAAKAQSATQGQRK